ncbi:hypothetical protein HCN44_006898 [Aphidius gifuensis]|uniref:Uncharacterized protein n=1 Tax=Aphidius gifuensis TaxID=684658 RepID=A0A834Y3E9_APHGI|nr:hypothetical protein HCN44_006898 [Aphidius gifuensis]
MVNVDEDVVLEEQTADDEMRPLVDELKLQGQVADEPFDNDKQSTIKTTAYKEYFCDPTSVFYMENVCSSTKAIDMSKKKLTSLPKRVFNGLDLLYISYNNLTDLPFDIFNNNKELGALCLQSNKFSEIEPRVFNNLTQLYQLNIQNNQFNLTEIYKESVIISIKQETYNVFHQYISCR